MIQSTPLEWGVENQSLGRDPFYIPKNHSSLQIFNEESTRWSMLLQLTSGDHPDFQWGDAGHLYVYGLRAEMEIGKFENCYLNFEC